MGVQARCLIFFLEEDQRREWEWGGGELSRSNSCRR